MSQEAHGPDVKEPRRRKASFWMHGRSRAGGGVVAMTVVLKARAEQELEIQRKKQIWRLFQRPSCKRYFAANWVLEAREERMVEHKLRIRGGACGA